MSAEDLLRRLAGMCGIQLEYHDIWQRRQQVPGATLRSLLGAMGVRTGSPGEIQAELARTGSRPWRRLLPPVLVAREPLETVQVPVTVPDDARHEPLVARLTLESGEVDEQAFVPADLPVLHRGELDGKALARRGLDLRKVPAPGYHDLHVQPARGDAPQARMRLIVAPRRCYLPSGLEGEGRVWGPSVQLYSLRSARNWGIGDYGDLLRLAGLCGASGAGMAGVNPLHAMFPLNPLHASPYSPSSRIFLNTIYLDVEAVPGFSQCEEARRLAASPGFQARLLALRQQELVDYQAVAAAKGEILELLWAHFRRRHLAREDDQGRAFRAFQRGRGEVLEAYGIFEALQEHFAREEPGAWGWPVWPGPYRRPDGEAVARFAAGHRDRVEHHQWLQWLCDLQLGAAGRRCLEQGLAVGLYQDLAVSVDRAGFDAWRFQDAFATEAGMGAPPDDFNLAGQDWGLPPMIPDRLRELAYRPFIESLAASMRHAGALRIDHVMGLMRAFWVPPGRPATEGAYVHYPFQDLLGVLALESRRNQCMVVGEDLGTVPDEVREALGPAGILSYRLFFFMKEPGGDFSPPSTYPEQALVAVTTHDLPTLAGWWHGRDIALRSELGLFPEERTREEQLLARAQDRARLLFALRHEGLLPEGIDVELDQIPELTPELVTAMHRYIARSPSKILALQLEDVLGQAEQVNLPGTTDQHPNWRRKLNLELEALESDERLRSLAAGLARERGGGRAGDGGPPGPGARPPRATYRLQLGADMTFSRAASLVPYLSELGISHLYTSPFLKARPGSPHGYDVIDHGSTSPEIGSKEDLEELVSALHRRGMGLVIDLVPNHMGIGSDNAWWMSVLEHGRASPWAGFFDIEWRPRKEELRGKVLLPVLEDHFGAVLERGLLQLRATREEEAGLEIAYHDHRFPLDPATYPLVLEHDLERLGFKLGPDHPSFLELQSLITALRNLPDREETSPESVDLRLRESVISRRRLARLLDESGEIRSFIAENVALFNAPGGDPSAFDLLELLLARQAYRLAYWRVAADEINYRRFFDINDLAGIRQENPQVFQETHRLVLDLVKRGRVDGLRIDHPDGLHDPGAYFRELRDATGPGEGTWIICEKILAAHERLPEDWPVDGTTGYEFCGLAGGLFVDPAAERPMDRLYTRWLGRKVEMDTLVYESKRLILDTALSSELAVLSNDLERISESNRHARDFTLERLREALAEIIAWFPVYRTYVSPRGAAEQERQHVEWAVRRARAGSRAREKSIYEFIRRVLLLEGGGTPEDESLASFAMKFQQTTGPVMAKAFEDTAFYVYNRLLSLNEVGSDPRRFGVSLAAFHRANSERAGRWPRSMLTTSTHDSKRSEDVRARISILSEMPDQWERACRRWAAINRSRKTMVDRRLAPSRNDEYALYQTLVGIWPAGNAVQPVPAELKERVTRYMLKAVREAKVHSSWIDPSREYEGAISSFIESLLGDPDGHFLREFVPLAERVSRLGMISSLSQVLLKLTCPGVPDIYQGNEVWDLSLVDPDNRRPVDFQRRARLLEELGGVDTGSAGALAGAAGEALREMHSGRAKLWLTWRALALRREQPDLFLRGSYEPLRTEGPQADRLCAFLRRLDGAVAVVVAPRLVAPLYDEHDGEEGRPRPGAWSGTRMALPGSMSGTVLRDVLCGVTVPVPHQDEPLLEAEDLLRLFPVSLLRSG